MLVLRLLLLRQLHRRVRVRTADRLEITCSLTVYYTSGVVVNFCLGERLPSLAHLSLPSL